MFLISSVEAAVFFLTLLYIYHGFKVKYAKWLADRNGLSRVNNLLGTALDADRAALARLTPLELSRLWTGLGLGINLPPGAFDAYFKAITNFIGVPQ